MYLLGQSLVNTKRNALMSVASASTVAVSLLVLALFVVLALNFGHMAAVLDAQVEIVTYLKPDFDRSREGQLMSQIRAIPGVKAATFVSKEEALARLKAQFGDQKDLLDAVERHNPLPDTVEVQTTDPSVVPTVAAAIGRLDGVDRADYKQDVVRRLFAFTRALRTAGLGLVALLAGATVVLVANTTRVAVYARREEITIMRLVGATAAFISWPFLLEGAILGLLGAAAAVAASWWGYTWIQQQVALALPFVPILPRQPLLWHLTEWLTLLGVGLGAAGSGWSVRRYLHA